MDKYSSKDNQTLTKICSILGKIAAGNLKLYLPFLLKEIQANPKRQYLLLHSLKEVYKCLIYIFFLPGSQYNFFPASRDLFYFILFLFY